MVIGTLLENDDISRYFFIFLIFSFLGGKRAENGPRWQKNQSVTEQSSKDASCRSYLSFPHSPILLLVEGLCFQINHSHSSSIKKLLVFFLPMSLNAIFSSAPAPTKLLPLLLQMILIIPLLLMSLLSAWMKLSVVKLFVVSIWTAQLHKHVNIAIFFVYFTAFDQTWPKHFYTTVAKRWFLNQSLFWKVTHI